MSWSINLVQQAAWSNGLLYRIRRAQFSARCRHPGALGSAISSSCVNPTMLQTMSMRNISVSDTLAPGAGTAAAQESVASPGPVHDYLGSPSPSAPGVEVQAWFPSHPRLQFPLGETVRTVPMSSALQSAALVYRLSASSCFVRLNAPRSTCVRIGHLLAAFRWLFACCGPFSCECLPVPHTVRLSSSSPTAPPRKHCATAGGRGGRLQQRRRGDIQCVRHPGLAALGCAVEPVGPELHGRGEAQLSVAGAGLSCPGICARQTWHQITQPGISVVSVLFG